ncbi:sporulation protein [Plantactinospora sp. GCM10030261]|uniref:sporulation protein n=1 Tax=Plantactinospora sp. GCM10030261 TaxID=3273420 RepID=UPI00361211ED
MVFKKMLSAFGVGGPSVDTVLDNPNTRPGLALTGQVRIKGGSQSVDLDGVTLSLVTRVEVEGHDTEYDAMVEFHRLPVAGRMQLAAEQDLAIPFQFPVPWETPITDVYGQRLRGMTMGLRTELAVARAVDKGDLDHVAVHPLPIHERILEAFSRLGFQFKNADLERGRIANVRQTLPFYQEIEFFAAPQYAHSMREVELTFVTNESGVDIVLEADKRGGFLRPGHDSYGRYSVPHADTDRVDWTQQLDGWLNQLASSRGGHGFGGHPGYPPAQHGYGHGHGRGGGMGAMGGMVAGGLLGVAGGMVAGEMIEDAFDGDGGDFGDFGEE